MTYLQFYNLQICLSHMRFFLCFIFSLLCSSVSLYSIHMQNRDVNRVDIFGASYVILKRIWPQVQNRVKVYENLGATVVALVAPVVMFLKNIWIEETWEVAMTHYRRQALNWSCIQLQSNLMIRNKLVFRNHFPWPIVNLFHKDKE